MESALVFASSALQRGGNMKSGLRTFTATSALLLLVCAGLTTASRAAEETGVTAHEIKLASCAALDGPARVLGIETVLGATTYVNYINDQGGVNGRKIQLLAFDDGYDPARADACFNRLKTEKVFAAGFFVGTPTAVKYVPLAQADKLPVVGLFTGAQLLYEPLKHYIVNVRASYYDETREQVHNLWDVIGAHKIAVIYQDDAFGKTVLEGVKLALTKYHSAPIATGTFERGSNDISKGLADVEAAHPQAVVLVGPYSPVAAIVKKAHSQGWHPIFLTVSFVGTEQFIKEAGPDAEGTIITQVVPPPDRTDLPTVKLYRDALSKYFPKSQPSFISLEGFLDAMVFVEGLKRAGHDLTREKFIEGIESMHSTDLGLGPRLKVNYSASNHKGLDEVYATVVRGGKPTPLNWSEVKHEGF
jgi:ABC-type branched-subunit amino acid transport system substrate-binding protein